MRLIEICIAAKGLTGLFSQKQLRKPKDNGKSEYRPTIFLQKERHPKEGMPFVR
jgi:hypothetical protein